MATPDDKAILDMMVGSNSPSLVEQYLDLERQHEKASEDKVTNYSMALFETFPIGWGLKKMKDISTIAKRMDKTLPDKIAPAQAKTPAEIAREFDGPPEHKEIADRIANELLEDKNYIDAQVELKTNKSSLTDQIARQISGDIDKYLGEMDLNIMGRTWTKDLIGAGMGLIPVAGSLIQGIDAGTEQAELEQKMDNIYKQLSDEEKTEIDEQLKINKQKDFDKMYKPMEYQMRLPPEY
jgi:hypothetical protein